MDQYVENHRLPRVGRIMDPQNVNILIPGKLWVCYVICQKGISSDDYGDQSWDGEGIMNWSMNYPGGLNLITSTYKTWKTLPSCRQRTTKMAVWERFSLVLLVLQGAISQWKLALPRSWETQGNTFFPRLPERNVALPVPLSEPSETHITLLMYRNIR